MPCQSWNEEWVAHLYGELDAAEERRLTEHLGGCPECRKTLEQLESSRRMLRELSATEPEVPRLVMLPQPPLRRPIWAFSAGLACASVLFAVGMLVGSRHLSPPSVPLDTTSAEEQAPSSVMTRTEVEEALRQMQRRLELEQARNTRFLLEEIDATEFRAGRWVDETRQAIQLVALQNDPRFSER